MKNLLLVFAAIVFFTSCGEDDPKPKTVMANLTTKQYLTEGNGWLIYYKNKNTGAKVNVISNCAIYIFMNDQQGSTDRLIHCATNNASYTVVDETHVTCIIGTDTLVMTATRVDELHATFELTHQGVQLIGSATRQ